MQANGRANSATHVRFTRKLILIGLVPLLLMCSGQAAVAKVKAVTELASLPENKGEQRLWDIASGHEHNIANEGRLYRNRELEAYLESIAQRLIGNRLQPLGLRIDFNIVRNNLLSAWVYPYGTISVNTGLMASVQNEAQLAAILAHELSHFLQRHSYRELIAERKQSIIGKGIGLLATAALASQTGAIDTSLMKAGGFWTDLVTSGYSRKLEHVADAEGLALMQAGGYDITQVTAAFRTLGENAEYGLVNPRLLWSSHPKLEDRIKNLEKAVAKARKSKDYEAGEPSDSKAYFTTIAPVLLYNGQADLRERMFDRAARAFERYRTVRPNDGDGHFWAGEALRLQNPDGPDTTSRNAAYQQAVRVEPTHADAYRELGMSYRQQRNVAQARAALERYLELRPDAVDAGIIRGYLSAL